MRRILGVLALAKKHGRTVVEDAGNAALDLALLTYRFVRRSLERRPLVPLTLRLVDPLIRCLNLYRDLIDRTTTVPRESQDVMVFFPHRPIQPLPTST